MLGSIDRFLDFSDLRQHFEPCYSHTGRPSVDPKLMIRMLLIGYCLGIRSERRLCEEVKMNLAYRWGSLEWLEMRQRLRDMSGTKASTVRNQRGIYKSIKSTGLTWLF